MAGEDDKDRLGDKLQKKEKADEDRFFAERERALLATVREKRTAPGAKPRRCPRDDSPLSSVEHDGVVVDECPTCHGVWLDQSEIKALAPRERESWIGRYFYRPKLNI